MSEFLTPLRLAAVIFLVAAGSIGGAWMFQTLGYAPCELCLKERIPYYVAMPLAALAAWLAGRSRPGLLAACFAAIALIFAVGAALGVYHAGVEWRFWPGPSDCTGPLDHASSVNDFLKQLQTVKVVRCDEVSLRVLGFSLAVWNAVISVGLTALAAMGLALSLRRPEARGP